MAALEARAADFQIRHQVKAKAIAFDALEFEQHGRVLHGPLTLNLKLQFVSLAPFREPGPESRKKKKLDREVQKGEYRFKIIQVAVFRSFN